MRAFLLLLLTPVAAAAAPVPKGADAEGPADLKGLHALVAKAVESGKWPADGDKTVSETVKRLLARVAKAGDVPERKLPVAFDGLERTGVTAAVRQTEIKRALVVAGDVQGTVATDSVILASGNVRVTRATNCIIIARAVTFTVAESCLAVADDFISGNGAGLRQRAENDADAGCVLVAGDSIHLTSAQYSICHVLRPDYGPRQRAGSPGSNPYPIRMTSGTKTLILNGTAHWQMHVGKDCKGVEPKTPVAK